ncbi:MAG: hypothetical protein AABX02_04585 [archaeon]
MSEDETSVLNRKLYPEGDLMRAKLASVELFFRIWDKYVKTGIVDYNTGVKIGNYIASMSATKRKNGYHLPTRVELFTKFPELAERRVQMRRENKRIQSLPRRRLFSTGK